MALLAAPALGQESPTPTPSPSPPPSPSPSPSPTADATAPAPAAQAPAPAPAAQTPAPDPSTDPSDGERRRRPRKRQRRQRRPHLRAERRRERQARQQCAPFSHTQTYTTWGPALSYGEPVTVAYTAERCAKDDGTAVVVTAEGSASVYRGTAVAGEPIDRRPFRMTGRWDRPTNEVGWPLAWWGCQVKLAEYHWEIPGVYIFAVGARWGVWSLDVASLAIGAQTQPSDFHWSYRAC